MAITWEQGYQFKKTKTSWQSPLFNLSFLLSPPSSSTTTKKVFGWIYICLYISIYHSKCGFETVSLSIYTCGKHLLCALPLKLILSSLDRVLFTVVQSHLSSPTIYETVSFLLTLISHSFLLSLHLRLFILHLSLPSSLFKMKKKWKRRLPSYSPSWREIKSFFLSSTKWR